MSVAHHAPRIAAMETPQLRADLQSWTALFVMLAGTLLSPIDFFIVNIGMPSIQRDLHATPAAMQLVLSGYACVYAVLLITGGRLGDIYGRRRVFLIGLCGFAVASVACGCAASAAVLVTGRIVQGSFAAMLMPQSLAWIRASFPEADRPRALGYYAATFGVGSILGQLFGGVLISANPLGLGWRSIFLVNVPIIVVIFPVALRLIRETRDERPQRLDIVGAIILALALSSLILPIVEGRERGWPAWTVVALLFSGPLFLLFGLHERRVAATGGDPLFAPEILQTPGLGRCLASTLLFYSCAAFFLLFSIYRRLSTRRGSLRRTGLRAAWPFGR